VYVITTYLLWPGGITVQDVLLYRDVGMMGQTLKEDDFSFFQEMTCKPMEGPLAPPLGSPKISILVRGTPWDSHRPGPRQPTSPPTR